MKNILKTILLSCFVFSSTYSQDYKISKLENIDLTKAPVFTMLYDTNMDILYIGTRVGLYKYKNNTLSIIEKDKQTPSNLAFSLKRDKKENIFFKSFDGVISKVNYKGIKALYSSSKLATDVRFWFFFNSKNELIIITSGLIKKIDQDGNETIIFDKNDTSEVNKKYGIKTINLCIESNNIIYFAAITTNGNTVFKLNNDKLEIIKKFPHNSKPNEYRFQSIFNMNNKIYAYNYNGKIINLIDYINNNITPFEKAQYFKFNKNKTIVLHEKKGFSIHSYVNDTITSTPLMFDNNFYSSFTKGKNNTFFLSTFGKGIYKFEPVNNQKKISKLYFEGIVLNGNNINYKEKQIFEHFENNFNFNFSYREISTKSNTKIIFKLKGEMTVWDTVSSDIFNTKFNELSPNKYSFQIKARYQNQETETFIYNFEISSPYWKKWWFITLVIIAILGIAFAIFSIYLIVKNKKQQIQLTIESKKKEAIDANLKALRSQMNPHFIFNAINSIQDLVLQKEALKSYDYLVLFSKLVRNILDFSEKGFISINEETEFLAEYLELEKLRFNKGFTYSITSDVKQNFTIPSLIVQPFIENAIKHGLLHKKGDKTLTVHFEMKEDLICTITDNGIGREKVAEIQSRRKSNHKSFSTNAIKERLAILEEQLGQKCEYKTIDLQNEDGSSAGTQIVVYLPKKAFPK